MLPLDLHRAARITALTADDGWLNLTDRVELSTGLQSVGSSPSSSLRLSCGPAYLGEIEPHRQCLITPDGQQHDFLASAAGFPQLRLSGLLLELHSVDNQPALRVRDLSVPRLVNIAYFPTNPSWIIRADWQALEKPTLQSVDQKGGATTTVHLTHTAHFSYAGQAITLLATHWKDAKPMFVVRDLTSGKQTYAASRFLIGEDATDHKITLDFNRAFTPPCGFTDFAICPLPPRENILPFRVEAGELTPS